MIVAMASSTQGRVERARYRASAQVRASAGSIVLAAVAAAVAWFVAHNQLGHQQPFFAPIAAAITLSTTPVNRALRILQLIAGVLLGIGVGEGLSAVLGTSAVALGLIVLVTLFFATIFGAGFFAEGTLFANQAAASAILVVTLHRHGTGGERAVDAVVGGAVAFVFGVLLFPPEPLVLMRGAERSVLQSLADTLKQAAGALASNTENEAGWLIARESEAHQRLQVLYRSCASARRIVLLSPRRWPLRARVATEVDRFAQLDTMVDGVLGLVRYATVGSTGERPFLSGLQRAIALLGTAVGRLAGVPRPWPSEVLSDVRDATDRVIVATVVEPVDHAQAVRLLLRTTALDIAELIGGEPKQPV
jgi:uncharacterized membrane protein YgaE (UPF0421/DUF939 family)